MGSMAISDLTRVAHDDGLDSEVGYFFYCHRCFACCLSVGDDENSIYINTNGLLVIFILLQPLHTQTLTSVEVIFNL